MTEEREDDLTEAANEAAPEAEATPAPAPAPELAPQADPEAEAEARKYGWKPKEEFNLAPDGWVDATRFLELPSTQVKMVRDVNRRLEKELRDRDRRLESIAAVQARAVERVREQERAAYEERLARLEEAKRAAAESGDLARYDQLAQSQRAMRPPEPIAMPQAPQPQADPELASYMQEAKWVSDPTAFAFAFQAIEDNPQVKRLPPMKQVRWAEARVREFFPEHFDAPAPSPQRPATQQHSRVDAGGMGAVGRRGKGVDDLPPEARKAGEMFVADGVFKNLGDYARDYFGG